MPLVNVWKCPKTGKLFEDKTKYIKHLRDLGYRNRVKRNKDVYRKNWKKLVKDLNSLSTSDAIAEWIENHSKELLINALNHYSIQWRVPKFVNNFHIKVTSLDLRRKLNIACTHSAPRGCKTNWGGDHTDRPSHYPGWTGHLEFGFSHEIQPFFSDVFRGTGINTGSGGSWKNFERDGIKYRGLHSYVTLWEADWPGLKMYHALTQNE